MAESRMSQRQAFRTDTQTRDRVPFNTKFRGFSLPRQNPVPAATSRASSPWQDTSPKEGDLSGPSISALSGSPSVTKTTCSSTGVSQDRLYNQLGACPQAPKQAGHTLWCRHPSEVVHCPPEAEVRGVSPSPRRTTPAWISGPTHCSLIPSVTDLVRSAQSGNLARSPWTHCE